MTRRTSAEKRGSESKRATRKEAARTDTPRVLVVYKKSAWQTNVKERRLPRYLQLVKQGHASVERLEIAHRAHQETLEETHRALDALGVPAVFRYRGDEGLVEGFDLVVTVGGDGTLLWAARWVGPEQPVVAINSAPDDSVGHFCAGKKGRVEACLASALASLGVETPRAKALRAFELTRMSVELDGEVVTRRVLNDVLFAHASPAATTRYLLRVEDGRRVIEEEHKSSGLWVGPSAGSTAAQRSAGGEVLAAESQRIQYVVREAYVPDDGTGRHQPALRLRLGTVSPAGSITLASKIREGRLFVDGPHRVRDVSLGSEVVLRASDEPLTLLGYPRGMQPRASTSKSARTKTSARAKR